MTINSLLIANRGEIAVRIIRTAKSMGIKTIAVYSDADVDALHVDHADTAVYLGESLPKSSYLNGERIIDLARRVGADAIHPGYGFLSENAAFVSACEQAQLRFVGPSSQTIILAGNKRHAKVSMLKAGVPCVPGYFGTNDQESTVDRLHKEAERLQFPLLIKATGGGGGRGMRIVQEGKFFLESLNQAQREAENAFGLKEVMLEKIIEPAKHIEVQILADTDGTILHLGERDCSLQRRYQKMIEETPAPTLSEQTRTKICESAVLAARAVNYTNAGTVEFLVDEQENFYFLEINTRLQVEHPVTEMVTGLDLVEWQLRIACGEQLPYSQEQIKNHGCAIEVRLCAENPEQQFRPETGTVVHWSFPNLKDTRVDHGLRTGSIVSAFYDSMLAKIIAYGGTREIAIRRLQYMITNTRLLGVVSNKQFLLQVLADNTFLDGKHTTQYLTKTGNLHTSQVSDVTICMSALLFFLKPTDTHTDKNAILDTRVHSLNLTCRDILFSVELQQTAAKYFAIRFLGKTFNIQWQKNTSDGRCWLTMEHVLIKAHFQFDDGLLWLDTGHDVECVSEVSTASRKKYPQTNHFEVTAPLAGKITRVCVENGATVKRGETLVVLEAMKMEHALVAPHDGTIAEIRAKINTQTKQREILAVIVLQNPP